ncbi:hypothetical protein COO20_00535 [Thalassospira marina]|uniref:EAL domain-containing protein n=2 Tax=Thalassospira marina TaxID=2048283 RepID=A0A2N3KZ48_9PROT|nr:hypothetical protein COO20_00535 [Thalassospira marina]
MRQAECSTVRTAVSQGVLCWCLLCVADKFGLFAFWIEAQWAVCHVMLRFVSGQKLYTGYEPIALSSRITRIEQRNQVEQAMKDLWLYDWMCRFRFLNYRGKIMVMAFIGTHIPLITLAVYFAFQSAPDWNVFFTTVGITLLATLGGTALTLYVLNALLMPVVQTSRSLRRYRQERVAVGLPTHYTDEVGTLMADASETIHHLDAVRHSLEYVDEVTGLPNRRSLEHSISMRMALEKPFHVAVVRFGNFSRLVQTVDPEEANHAAQLVAERLDAALAGRAQLARIGKAEFAFYFDKRDLPLSTLNSRLNDILQSSSDDIIFANLTYQPELLCGVVAFPEDGQKAENLVSNAISAARQGNAGSPVVHHSFEARGAAFEQLKLEQDLRLAIERGEFVLFYQPVVNMQTGTVEGAEALIRWQHPERGLLGPQVFIPVAEEAGLIDQIGQWVLREACAQVHMWEQAGKTSLRISVNLSARQLLEPSLIDQVFDAISQSGIAPQKLELELTETAAMADYANSFSVFNRLRERGVTIAIDDFGTGYASMSYLRQLPFDKLKIDREFVQNVQQSPDGQAICRAMVALAQGLGQNVVAEGVENVEEASFLSDIGVQLFQGFYFARPVPVAEFDASCLAIGAMARPQTLH